MGIVGLAWVLTGPICNFFCKRILLGAVPWLLMVGPALCVWRLLIMMPVSKLLLSLLDANAMLLPLLLGESSLGRIWKTGFSSGLAFWRI